MDTQNQDNVNEQGSVQYNEEINKNVPTQDIKSQENVLSGLSDKERDQAAEADHKGANDLESGLSEKERTNAAEADGKIDSETKGGLSDQERREAADESW
jgi:hypothetical protein